MSGSVVVVVGNPRVGSRTGQIARQVAERAAASAGLPADVSIDMIELAELAGALLDWTSPDVAGPLDLLKAAQLAVVASPTFKGTYSGLLKAFIDRLGQDDLAGVTAIPVLVGGNPAHALAVEVHLRALLVEIGASVPTRGLYVVDSELDQLDGRLEAWAAENGNSLARALRPIATT